MKKSVLRILERIVGAALVLLGLMWLFLGLRSLGGENLVLRGAVVVVAIAGVLVLTGVLLAKPKHSNFGRVFAILVCILGAFREVMLLNHQTTETLATGGWMGLALLTFYVLIVLVVVASLIVYRRHAVQ